MGKSGAKTFNNVQDQATRSRYHNHNVEVKIDVVELLLIDYDQISYSILMLKV